MDDKITNRRIREILNQDIPQEALAEGNKTPEEEAVDFIETLLQEEREKVVLEIAVNLTEVFEKYSDEMTDEEVRGFSLMNGFAHGILDRYLSKKGEKE